MRCADFADCSASDSAATRRLRVAALGLAWLAGCARDAPPPTAPPPPPRAAADAESTTAGPLRVAGPFAAVGDSAVLTLRRILEGSRPIRYVVHDDEGDWQFLDGEDVSEEDAATVSLRRLVDLDSSVETLADLPKGWVAERENVDAPWRRSPR